MNKQSGNKEKIYQLLQKEPLTSIELAEKLIINEDPEKNIQFIRTYLQRLIKAKLIESVDKNGRYNVYCAIQRESNEKTELVDTQILKKMIKPFVEKNIDLDLENDEIERIKVLWEEMNTNA